jgi:beta-1,4-N-acetylglucosaminyltransferase
MIFVAVGTATQPFNRLVRAADELASMIDEDVIIQIGHSDHLPIKAQYFNWGTMQEMEENIRKSRLVISQAGAGTIISVLQKRKPLIVAPRLKEFQEHFNDHQLELAMALEKQERARLVIELSGTSLFNAISQLKPSLLHDNSSQLIADLNNLVHKWMTISGENRKANRNI